MKIKTTKSEDVEIDVTLPFFRKNPNFISDNYIGVLDEKTMVYMFTNEASTNVAHRLVEDNKKEIVEAFTNWTPISEEEFLSIHAKLLKSLSLIPELMINMDDLKDINI